MIAAIAALLTGSLPVNLAEGQTMYGSAPSVERFNGCGIENRTFFNGEEIVYKIYYQVSFIWMSAGEVVFRVNETPKHYHITVDGRTYGSYDVFYRVRDRYETWIDKKTLLPVEFKQELQQGKYRRYEHYLFDQNTKSVVAYKGKTPDAELRRKEVTLDDCMHDLISILYYVRNMNFDQVEAGQRFPIEVFLGKQYDLSVRILEKNVEQRVRGQGKYMTHLFSPELIESELFREKDAMRIWVSADENKIPLLIESPLSVGKMKAVLKSHSGLRHELDCRL